MRPSDEDLGFPGNREIIERALAKSTTQVLFLAQDEGRGNRTLVERGAESVRGIELMPTSDRFWAAAPEPSAVAAASKDGIPADIAEAYMRAKTEVKAILADAVPALHQR
jgi:hypothetical protein